MKKTLKLFLVALFATMYLLFPVGNLAVASPVKDFETNKPVKPKVRKPLNPAMRKEVGRLVNSSHRGLVEVKKKNGVGMKLKGRFRAVPVATIEENGEVSIRDYTAPPVE